MSLSLEIHDKYGVGCQCGCCGKVVSWLTRQYWRHGMFRKTANYDFYVPNIAANDNYSLGKRPTLPNRISKRYYSIGRRDVITCLFLKKMSRFALTR